MQQFEYCVCFGETFKHSKCTITSIYIGKDDLARRALLGTRNELCGRLHLIYVYVCLFCGTDICGYRHISNNSEIGHGSGGGAGIIIIYKAISKALQFCIHYNMSVS